MLKRADGLQRKECIAMILAGGQGSRLGVLTQNLAKPAVPFGGKYRIIDFTLSNCTHSNIETVGVLTQYQPLALTSSLGIGSPWDLDRKHGGVTVLPPFVKKNGGEWYRGTANAVYQNLDFIDLHAPEYVLILSGDHVYRMDYSKMLDYHKERQAEVTIAVLEVPWIDASRFGIMHTNESGRIIEFSEKPAQPRSNMASMGIYIFEREILKDFLHKDENNPHSTNDFGKDVIPAMLEAGVKMYAYRFSGYWKDVGTIKSLWEANMDLLGDEPELVLHDPSWRIYSVNQDLPPHYIGEKAAVTKSLVNEGCFIEGEVEHSVVFPGVVVEEGSVVKDSILMPYARVGKNVKIHEAIIDEYTDVGDNCQIGWDRGEEPPSLYTNGKDAPREITVVGEKLSLQKNTRICKGTVIDPWNSQDVDQRG